jgi:glycosyltransferase involved in cell wall biosynthesis
VRLLFLNWRDIRSPNAGGAEVLTHEIAKRLVARGHSVTWFSSRPDGLPATEEIDGIEVVRSGSETTTRLSAPSYARRDWDLVVEEINTLPYFSHRFARCPVALFIMQLAREVWWYEAPKALAPLGYASEPRYLRSYRDVPSITISMSTRDDLRALGFRAPVWIVPVGVYAPPARSLASKEPVGRLVIVCRLVPSKRVDHAIEALALLVREFPQATLTVIGEGPERQRLESKAEGLGVDDAVVFAGHVDEALKNALLRDSDILVACAVREGWGLTVTEAARQGTPAVAYRVPGLRDSVVDGRTGVLTDATPASLADAAASLLRDRKRYADLRRSAWVLSAGLSWDRSALAFERAVGAIVAGAS